MIGSTKKKVYHLLTLVSLQTYDFLFFNKKKNEHTYLHTISKITKTQNQKAFSRRVKKPFVLFFFFLRVFP